MGGDLGSFDLIQTLENEKTQYYVWHGEGQCDNKTDNLEEARRIKKEFLDEGIAAYIADHENNTIGDEMEAIPVFDAGRQFDSPTEAIALIMQQSNPTEALLAVVRANVEAGECGFASEVIRDFGGI
ncbi:hypothetical protein QN372_19235 [Undibacterium sp. RTI2.1]|nr:MULTISPECIES: hypothetical protein [unclassified Undibacterium]MEB0032887.1 hypothetical protein [Undibacterium sp. RTI2.1]MEB0118792.1 hypothetical protein [Undibacterium sp. RTI2.2]